MRAPIDIVLANRRGLRDGTVRRYSRFVALTKWLLPTIAVVLLLLVVSWARIRVAIDAMHFGAVHLDLTEARNLRMVGARYAGIDKENRPFVVTAETATQTPQNGNLVSLDAPKADLTTTSGSWLELAGRSGIYQPDGQLLDLTGDVELFQDKGNEFHSASARIDMATGLAEGKEPIEGQGPFGHVTADGFRMLNRGDTIMFTGHTRLDLAPHHTDVAAAKKP